MIRIVLGATAREAGNALSRPVGGEGQQGCIAGLSITDEGRLCIDDTARLRALLFDSKRMGKVAEWMGNSHSKSARFGAQELPVIAPACLGMSALCRSAQRAGTPRMTAKGAKKWETKKTTSHGICLGVAVPKDNQGALKRLLTLDSRRCLGSAT